METKLEHAKLAKIEKGKQPTTLEVQFNPESLKLSYSNQVAQPPNPQAAQTGSVKPGANKVQPPTTQFVGRGATKLSLQLWFDVTGELPPASQGTRDVRDLTEKVVALISFAEGDKKEGAAVPPQVRFSWGTFLFEGVLEGVEESLEFFSPDGRPLRASLSLSLTKQDIIIQRTDFRSSASASAGTRKLTSAPAGSSVQGMAAAQGLGDNWQAIAQANGIENPRTLQPGQLIDFNVRR